MDKLEHEISEMRKLRDSLREKIILIEVELSALERAAKLRPVPESATPTRTAPKGGRQPGAISQSWRRILETMVTRHQGCATSGQIAALGQEVNIPTLDERLVRQRMTLYMQHGYIEPAGGDLYCVTDQAMMRFNLPRQKTHQEGTPHPENVRDLRFPSVTSPAKVES